MIYCKTALFFLVGSSSHRQVHLCNRRVQGGSSTVVPAGRAGPSFRSGLLSWLHLSSRSQVLPECGPLGGRGLLLQRGRVSRVDVEVVKNSAL